VAKITSFGLFWRRDEIEWEPGQGVPNAFCLWGRIGQNKPSRRVCDFRFQQGIYILYDEYGPTYVGLSGRRKNGDALGQRLKEHTEDHLKNDWSRFSWFGFDKVSDPDADGHCLLQNVPQISEETAVSSTIRDTEALIMNIILPKSNRSITRFSDGEQWNQIDWHDIKKYTEN
jgi:hypothetical protein